MKKITLSLLFGFMSLIGFSQVGLVENFDSGFALPAGWSSDVEDYSVSFFENCDGNSIRANLNSTNLDAQLISPNVIGQSNGTDLTIAFDYKIVDWPDVVNGTVPGWGEILIQYSTNDGGTWTTIETINDSNHNTLESCANWSVIVPAASLPIGSDFKLRLDANWASGSYYIYLDNISATQVVEDPPSCVNLVTPSGSTGVSINTNLEWTVATGIPTGYTVTVGTTSGGTDIADNINVGLSTTYDLPVLDYATTYYVSITPFNSNGDALGCTEYSFITGADPNAPVDCAAGTPINTVYCYTNDDTQSWNFQSSDGSPLNVFFNAGTMEGGNFDQVTVYDGTDNTGTVLFDDSNGGNMTGVSVTSPSGSMFIEIDSDGSISCESNNYTPLDFDVSCVDAAALPNCNASLITPANGEVDVDENTALSWSAASILVTGYNLSIGTTPGGTDILNNFDVGNALTYNPGTLLYETTYYVTIVPYNDNGSAINCNEESFTTRNDPNQTVDCSINEIINTTYCYENGTNNVFVEIFNFQSSNGAPLSIIFNSGEIEDFWDTLRITDSDGSIIYEGDNGGDLTGLNFVTTGDALAISIEADGSGSCASSNYTPWDFDVTCVDTAAIPNCNASLISPANGAVDINENDDLIWGAATVFVTGYNLSIGTSPGAVDVLDNVDVGNVLTYEPGTLDYSTTYYVTIVPYNDNGIATGCTEQSFTIREDPNQIVDCASGQIINSTYCYENASGGAGNNVWVNIFSFQSSDGSPLAISFNSGNFENNFDTLRITDSDGSIIFEDDGELTGLSFFSTGDSLAVWFESDGSVSCASGSRPIMDFDVACFDPLAPPFCNSVMNTPIDGSIDVDINTGITWSEASIIVTGYTISIGTTPGGTDVADNVDVGNVLNYNPGTLVNATEYFVSIVPYNDNGPATGCVEETFRTICIPQEVSFNAIGDCDTDPNNPDFILEVTITDLSGSASILVSDDQGSPVQTATETGVITMGPYAANTVVTITTVKSDDDTCDVVSSPITFICPPPPNPCSIVYAGEDATVDCADTSTDLSANFHLFGQDTNTYIINGLDTCPLPSTVGGTPTSLDIDDTWSDVLEIGFQFCFFGEVYSQILVGSNGVLSFELENANTGNGWALGAGDTLPNNTNATLAEANIFGVGHDIDPSITGDINYLVIGSAPYRQFVVNYTNVAHYSGACNNLLSSSQIILYESSNNIDVNVFDKPICPTWNSGRAVIGVQNVPGTVAFTPPGRNTGAWTATDESWRFAPSQGTPNYTFEWFDGTTSLGNTDIVTVSPTETTTYTASVTYELCTGGTATITDEVVVEVVDNTVDTTFTMTPSCDGGTATITGDTGGTFTFDPDPADGAVIDTVTGEVTGGVSGEIYTVVYSITNTCTTSNSIDLTVLPAEDASFTITPTCDGGIATITGNTGGTFTFNPMPIDGAVIDAATGTVTGGISGTIYTVEYTSAGTCPATSTQVLTTIPGGNSSFTMMPTCDGGTATITGDTGGIFTFNPVPTDGAVIDATTGTVTGGTSGTMYTIEYVTTGVCTSTGTQTLTVLPMEDATFTATATCDGSTVAITGDLGGTFTFNPDPADGAVIDAVTGVITGGMSGSTYTIEYTTSGACAVTSTQTVTVLPAEDATFTMTADCNGGTASITGDMGGTFTFNPVPTDGASIDPVTGQVTGTSGATYTVVYTTSGVCPATSSQTVTVLPADDATFTMTATCDGATATVTGDAGGTFTFSPVPADGASIDDVTGEIMAGIPGTTYNVVYTTSGVCPETNTIAVTILTDVFDFVVNGDCNGAIYELTVEPISNGFDPNNTTYTLYDDMNSLLQTNTIGDNIFIIDASNFTPPMSGSSYNYVVEVTNDSGCIETKQVLVESINCIIPQGISPNNDNKNDSFDLTGYDVSRLEIFNRHGMKVYSKTNYTNDWYGQSDAGDELPVGTYFYVMEYQGNKTRTSWIYLNREN